MQYHAEITALDEDGILERILRVCRHRGFAIHQFHSLVDPTGTWQQIKIQGESQRPLQLLTRQLEKFYDIVKVAVDPINRETQGLSPSQETHLLLAPIRSTVYASIRHG